MYCSGDGIADSDRPARPQGDEDMSAVTMSCCFRKNNFVLYYKKAIIQPSREVTPMRERRERRGEGGAGPRGRHIENVF